MRDLDKRSCFARAAAVAERESDEDLRYACLELRLCLEALAYEALSRYSNRIPPGLLDTWQPRVMMKALLQFEPRAATSHVVRSFEENDDGSRGRIVFQDQHSALSFKTLSENYDRLGSYLHLPTLAKQADRQWIDRWYGKLRKTISELLTVIAPAVECSFHSSMATVIDFNCGGCGKKSVVNARGVEESKRAFCVLCGALHHAVCEDEGEVMGLLLDATEFECIGCDEGIPIQNRHLDIGSSFTCPSCGTQHLVSTRQWGYGIHPDEDPPGDSSEG